MTEHDNARTVWTDAELDTTLAALHKQPDLGHQPLARAGAALFAAIADDMAESPTVPTGRRRFRWAWVASAAAVAVLAAGVPVVVNTLTGGTPTASTPVLTLQRAAGVTITQKDTPVGPGQYRYIAQHTWSLAKIANDKGQVFAQRIGYLTQTWVPYDQTQDWTQDNAKTGQHEWVVGSAELAAEAGADFDQFGPPDGRITAPCGDFHDVFHQQKPSCLRTGNWKEPTSMWLATLPRDPHQLLTTLVGTGTFGQPDISGLAIQRSAMALRSGLVPADLRAAIYQALALLPDLQVTEQSANLDGRTGVGFGVVTGDMRWDIIIDPATGEFIGERQVQAKDDPDLELKAGTVLNSTSVTTGVVDATGTKP